MTVIRIELPDDIAQQASQAGLLNPIVFVSWLTELLRHNEVDRFFNDLDRLREQSGKPASADFIQSEIRASRAQHA
jgi:hypothetical protein